MSRGTATPVDITKAAAVDILTQAVDKVLVKSDEPLLLSGENMLNKSGKLISYDELLNRIKHPHQASIATGDSKAFKKKKSNLAWFTCSNAMSKTAKSITDEVLFSACVIDYDEGNKTLTELVECLSALGAIACAAYTTITHQRPVEITEGTDKALKNRLGAVIPLKYAVNSERWRVAQRYFIAALGGDKAMLSKVQISYMPFDLAIGGERSYHYEIRQGEGLDLISGDIADAINLWADSNTDSANKAEKTPVVALDTSQAVCEGDIKGVIDYFNQTADIHALLVEAGYERQGNKYLPPNSESGIAGGMVMEDGNHFMAFNSSDELCDEKRHSCFDILLIITGGDEVEALERARNEFGYLESKYAYIASEAKYADIDSGMLLKTEALNNIEAIPCRGLGCSPAEKLKYSPETLKVAKLSWLPCTDKVIEVNGLKCLNTYIPPRKIDCEGFDLIAFKVNSHWLALCKSLIPDDEIRDALLDWMAFVVQKPNEKINWQIMLGGNGGIGKDSLVEPLRRIIGVHNCASVDNNDLASQFNDHLSSTKLLILNELNQYNHAGRANDLKPLCAAPPMTLSVNPKGFSRYEIPNVVGIIGMTNHKVPLVFQDADRRWLAIWCKGERVTELDTDNSPTPEEVGNNAKLLFEYNARFEAVWAEILNKDSLNGIGQFLMSRDLSAFKHSEPPIKTKWTRSMEVCGEREGVNLINALISGDNERFNGGLIDFDEIKYEIGVENTTTVKALLTEAGLVKRRVDFKRSLSNRGVFRRTKRAWVTQDIDALSNHQVVARYIPEWVAEFEAENKTLKGSK